MDIDNFDFRPLTDGLGFDKTTEESRKHPVEPKKQLKKEPPILDKQSFELNDKSFTIPNKTPVSRSLKKMLDSLPPSVDFTEDKNRELAGALRQPTLEVPLYKPELDPSQFDVTLDNSLAQAFPKEEVDKRFYHQMVTPVAQYQEMSSSFASAIIDAFIVLGLASLFVVSLVALTGVDIFAMLSSRELSGRTMLELSLLYAGVTLFYFMLSRGMFGSTLGDWAFDVQLGSEKERAHIMYPFQVIFRTFVILVTGIVMVPICSMAFGKDLAYYFSGLKLYSRQY